MSTRSFCPGNRTTKSDGDTGSKGFGGRNRLGGGAIFANIDAISGVAAPSSLDASTPFESTPIPGGERVALRGELTCSSAGIGISIGGSVISSLFGSRDGDEGGGFTLLIGGSAAATAAGMGAAAGRSI